MTYIITKGNYPVDLLNQLCIESRVFRYYSLGNKMVPIGLN